MNDELVIYLSETVNISIATIHNGYHSNKIGRSQQRSKPRQNCCQDFFVLMPLRMYRGINAFTLHQWVTRKTDWPL